MIAGDITLLINVKKMGERQPKVVITYNANVS